MRGRIRALAETDSFPDGWIRTNRNGVRSAEAERRWAAVASQATTLNT
jgi:hypothetical protein